MWQGLGAVVRARSLVVAVQLLPPTSGRRHPGAGSEQADRPPRETT
jgi:hypothetical protein